jgi:hypothetical protein
VNNGNELEQPTNADPWLIGSIFDPTNFHSSSLRKAVYKRGRENMIVSSMSVPPGALPGLLIGHIEPAKLHSENSFYFSSVSFLRPR